MRVAARAGGSAESFGRRSRGTTLLFYAAMVVVAVVVLRFTLVAGSNLTAPTTGPATTSGAHPAVDAHTVFWRFLIASSLIVAASRALGTVFRRIGQPQVVGEIIAGVLLGPSVFGALLPTLSRSVFSDDVLPFIDLVAQLGLIFFMFLIGLELDMRLIRGRGQAALTVSQVSIVVPFLLGTGAALLLFPSLGSAQGRFVPFALFLGASMSITAFPVLARILTERGLYKTKLGTVAITCAAVDDVTAWCLLAVVVAVSAASGLGGAFLTMGLSIVFIALMVLVVRPFLGRLAAYHEARGEISASMLALVIVGILVSAVVTDRIGIHAIFGAFLFGAIMPQRSELVTELLTKFEDFVVLFLLPLFFAYSGLRTQLGLLGTDTTMWLFTGLVIVIAIAGKWGGSTLAGRVVGLQWREAMGLGTLMNCRGLTELVILNIGLDLGVIPPALFAMLVIMALVTTFMTTPLLALVYPRDVQERMIAEESPDAAGEQPWRVLVPISNVNRAHELVHNALSLAEPGSPVQVILLRVLRFPTAGGPRRLQAATEGAMRSLRPLVQFVEGAGHDAVALAIPSPSVADTIVRVAAERAPSLVLLEWRKPLFGRDLLDSTLGEVFERVETDLAILVDPTGQGILLQPGSVIAVPFGGGFHETTGIDLAVRLARTSNASLRLVGDTDGSHELAEVAAQAYEANNVWTTAVVTDDVVAEVCEQANDVDLVVLGVSDEWSANRRSFGRLRSAIAARSSAPMLIVRRHGQVRPRLRRPDDWMRDSGDLPVLDLDRPSPAARNV